MPQTVLIIDDFAPLHELVKMHLEAEALTIHSAYGGVEALMVAVAVKPDLILLDVDMPDMNGFDVCRFLKVDPVTADIPVIFLSAAGSADEKVCGLSLRAVDYITKPFNADELCERVRTALRTKRLLDLLPKTAAEGDVFPKREAQGRHSNIRFSMAALERARSHPRDV